MSISVNNAYNFKGIKCVKLQTEKYVAIISPEMGCNVLRLFDKTNDIEVFRYSEDCSISDISQVIELWGLPTLYLPNRFDNGVLKTSDGIYQFPINETDLNNFIHGWIQRRVHKVDTAYVEDNKAVLNTSYTFNKDDEMYEYFPVDFAIKYTFKLSDENGLEQTITLVNLSDKKLPVSICTHTSINAPMTLNGNEDTMRLSVPILEKCELDNRCLPTEKLLQLDDWDMEYNDGVKLPILQDISNDMYTAGMNKLNNDDFYGIIVTDIATGHKICNEISKEFKFWNIWNHNGDKGYFCPEPMTAMINAPNLSLPHDVTGYTELSKNQEYSCWQRFFTI